MSEHAARRTVAGLTCAEWGPASGSPVLALHGLTGTSQVWSGLAAALPEFRVVAPDLPGRGGSVAVRAGAGLAGQVKAVVALAYELDLTDVTVVGHSVGAFLAPPVVRALGDRVRRIVLADGGVGPDPSPLLTKPVVRARCAAQALLRGRRWRNADAYVEAIHGKALRGRPDLRPAVRQWAVYLLDGNGRARLDRRRLIVDAADSLAGQSTLGAVTMRAAPVHLLAASRGAHDGAEAFLSDAALARARALVPRLTSERVEANHVTLLFDPRLAAAVRTDRA